MLEEIARSVGGGAERAGRRPVPARARRTPLGGTALTAAVAPRRGDVGIAAHDVSAAFAAGLTTRPVGATATDTLAWLRSEEEPARTGLTRAEEHDLLREWHSIRA